MKHLTHSAKTIAAINATAAGTSNVSSGSLALTGVDAVRAIAVLGTLTSTQVTSLALYGSTDNGTTFALLAVTANAADADGNKLLIVDVIRPNISNTPCTHVKAVVNRGTANAVINCVIVEEYELANAPPTQDTSVSQYVLAVNAT